MATKAKNPTITIRNRVIKQMKEMKIYHRGFDDIIRIYADLLYEYEIKQEDFKLSGYKVSEIYTNNKGGQSERKTPLYMALEVLRKDILNYSAQLGLNPKSLKNTKGELQQPNKKSSSLAKALSDDGGSGGG